MCVSGFGFGFVVSDIEMAMISWRARAGIEMSAAPRTAWAPRLIA